MPVLNNAKHELFAQGIAKGESQRQAYIAAGYTASINPDVTDAAASRLLRDVRVSARVQELQNKAAARAEITLESWIQEGAELMRAALAAGDSTAASQQYERVAKVAGFWIDRSEGSQVVRSVSAEPMTPEQWEQQHAAKPHAVN